VADPVAKMPPVVRNVEIKDNPQRLGTLRVGDFYNNEITRMGYGL